jgi:hypothetical protein
MGNMDLSFRKVVSVRLTQHKQTDVWYEIAVFDSEGNETEITLWSANERAIQVFFGEEE